MTTVTVPSERLGDEKADVPVRLIDCDVHLEPRAFEDLIEYMEGPWKDRAVSARIPEGRPTYTTLDGGSRADSYPEQGDIGSDPALVEQQLFIETKTDYAIVLPLSYRGFSADPALDTALSGAVNQWLADTWLTEHNDANRYVGSITVSVEDPVGAAREIEKWADHPGFRQVQVGHYGPRPFGHPMYDPIWEAAARHRLPISMHFRAGATQPLGWTATGPLQYFVEYHSLIAPMAYATHMASWICNGVLDRNPDMRVIFLEGGFLWYRPFIDRLERHWDRTGQEFGTAKRPMEYVRDHFRWASQPIEESPDPLQIARLFDEADAAHLLAFSSDYPHYDYDHPGRALPRGLDAATKQRIFAENARELYDLPAARPVDRFDGARS
jgi:predicted TIM-barrel fold metal-dependent hydrolase